MRVYLFCLLLASLWLPYPALLSVLAMHLLLRLLGLLLPAARHLAWRAEQALGFVGWYAGQPAGSLAGAEPARAGGARHRCRAAGGG